MPLPNGSRYDSNPAQANTEFAASLKRGVETVTRAENNRIHQKVVVVVVCGCNVHTNQLNSAVRA
jgi:hypothetical protein